MPGNPFISCCQLLSGGQPLASDVLSDVLHVQDLVASSPSIGLWMEPWCCG